MSTPSKKRRIGSDFNFDDTPSLPTSTKSNPNTRWKRRDSKPLSSPQHMSSRESRLSSSDAAAAMVSRLRTNNEDVTVVSLPRGTVKTLDSEHKSRNAQGSFGSAGYPSNSISPSAKPTAVVAQLLQRIGIIELLEQDTRPTCVIDLQYPANASRARLNIIYSNAVLRSSKHVLELLDADGDEAFASPEFVAFQEWVTMGIRAPDMGPPVSPPRLFGGILWTSATLRGRFRILSGTAEVSRASHDERANAGQVQNPRRFGQSQETLTPSSEVAQDYFRNAGCLTGQADVLSDVLGVDDDGGGDHADEFTRTVPQSQLASRPSFDWTKISLTSNLPDHIYFARTLDWASTPLGPVELWSADLRAMANLIMASPHPAAMYWGPEHVAIYNESYVEIAGQKHPSLMGKRYSEAWAEIWPEIEPVFQKAFETGQSVMKEENQLFLNRHGFLEETFFSWSIVPIVGADGEVVGLYNPAFENTGRRVAERRMLTLRELGELTTQATDVKSFWQQVLKGFRSNPFDVPFALIYSAKSDNGSESSTTASGSVSCPPQLVLEGSLGVPDEHPAAKRHLYLPSSEEGFAPYMREALQNSDGVAVLSTEDGTLPSALLEGFQRRGFGDPCSTVVILPIHPTTTSETEVAFIILGINPRRPYDGDSRLFVTLLSRQLSTSMASVVLYEEEVKRGRMAALIAAQNNQELSEQLMQRTQEAVESEYKFTRMAEFAPVGMFIAGPDGRFNYCNDEWWHVSGHPRTEPVDTWMESVRDEDRAGLDAIWKQLIDEKLSVTHEFRFKSSRQNGDQRMETWVLMSAYSEKDSVGSVKSIFGCMTDISSQKWAEYFQNQRREEAVELKRQQENFIDITSHEMRNPLSAILQCADEIFNGVMRFRSEGEVRAVGEEADAGLADLLESCAEAANTINLCASHQKRIVNDILTLSKLDSKLLLVTPVDVQAFDTILQVLKMFEAELATHSIALNYEVEQSYIDHEIDWLRLDPSRLCQVVINLMTNAIKFTQNCEKRSITVSIGACKSPSDLTSSGVALFPSPPKDVENPTHNEEDWGYGPEINLYVSVRDTGPGISDEEKKALFQRFSQASPRTHVRYGGSGLGLFISRMLTELQGGQISVTSQKNVGSTFTFYIKARKSDSPPKRGTPLQTRSMQIGMPRPDNSPLHPTAPQRRPSHRMVHGVQLCLDVLIVEDNLVNQKVLERQLRNQGSTTHVANHGGEALDILRSSRFWKGNSGNGINIAVILMDLEMPVMDGTTCVKKIRELEKDGIITRHLPVIAVTAYARPEQINEAITSGMVSPRPVFYCL